MPKGHCKPLTPQDEQKIKDEYLSKPTKGLADEIGISYGRVMRFLHKNGLSIPKELIEERKQAGRMKKGNTPFNKGKKQIEYMSEEAIARTLKTRFKKGQRPHNTNKQGDGAISVRKDSDGTCYKYIRVSLNRWELYHRHLWESEHGEIPKGRIVVFKDGNSMNVTLDNLELITRAENMYRNSRHGYPAEVIPSLLLVNQINKTLQSIQNEEYTLRPQ